jgi:hypothetical protein
MYGDWNFCNNKIRNRRLIRKGDLAFEVIQIFSLITDVAIEEVIVPSFLAPTLR